MQLAIRESAHFFDLRGAERLGHVLCWSKILSSPCLLVTQEHRRYLHVCQPRYLSFLSLWSPFPLSRASLSFPLLSYPSFFSLSPSYSSFVLSLSLSLVATLPSLFVIVSSTRSCSPAFAQALNAIYDHRYVLSRHIRSGWSLAFSPFTLLIASLFGLLVGSPVLQAYLARPFLPTNIRFFLFSLNNKTAGNLNTLCV